MHNPKICASSCQSGLRAKRAPGEPQRAAFCSDPPDVCSDPPDVCSDPPGLCSDPPELCSDPPGLCSDPPELCSDPPELRNDPPGLCNDPPKPRNDPPNPLPPPSPRLFVLEKPCATRHSPPNFQQETSHDNNPQPT